MLFLVFVRLLFNIYVFDIKKIFNINISLHDVIWKLHILKVIKNKFHVTIV